MMIDVDGNGRGASNEIALKRGNCKSPRNGALNKQKCVCVYIYIIHIYIYILYYIISYMYIYTYVYIYILGDSQCHVWWHRKVQHLSRAAMPCSPCPDQRLARPKTGRVEDRIGRKVMFRGCWNVTLRNGYMEVYLQEWISQRMDIQSLKSIFKHIQAIQSMQSHAPIILKTPTNGTSWMTFHHGGPLAEDRLLWTA